MRPRGAALGRCLFALIPALSWSREKARGLARDFLRRVSSEADTYDEALSKLWEPIAARQRKYPERKIRSELLQTLAARWERELPGTFRLSFEASIRGAKGAVRETRISAGHMRSDDPDWEGDDETGAAILTQQALADSRSLRRAALLHKVPYYTTLAGAIAASEAIAGYKAGDLEVKALQDYFA